MNDPSRSAHGHPFTASAVVGSFTLALVVLLRVAGLFQVADNGFRDWFVAQGFAIAPNSIQPWWDFLFVMGFVYAFVWLLFETPGALRRFLVLLTTLVLLLTAAPVLALWGVFWTPVGAMLAAVWGGACALLWAHQHPMPCELPQQAEAAPDRGKIVPMKRKEQKGEDKDAGKQKSRKDRGGAKG